MGRLKRNYQIGFPYHIGARSNNREAFPLSMEDSWSIFSEQIHSLIYGESLRVHGFVLMINHFHLMATFQKPNHSAVLTRLMTGVSKTMNFHSGRVNHIFGGRNFASRIDTESGYLSVLKYILRNPVEAGVVGRACDYRYSTLHTTIGKSSGLILASPLTSIDDATHPRFCEFLKWVERPFDSARSSAIRSGLKRSDFKVRIDRVTRKPIALAEDLEEK